jgi:alkyl sulfatase BDS1-like metallo-beta-lactamase superfamily hydrolase
MGEILDLAERAWQGSYDKHWHPSGAREEIAPDLFFLNTFANVSVVRTSAGLVLIDTGSHIGRSQTFAAVRHCDPAPVFASIYTHGHVDHAFGLPPFLAEAQAKNWERIRIVGHQNVGPHFDRYRATSGYNSAINTRQFGVAVQWPTEFDYPDVTYDESLQLDAGGSIFELRHARGETDDHTWIYWPQRKVLFTGDQFIWVTPNAGNPQKVQRYAADWAQSLRTMSKCEAEILVPGHGLPIFGRSRVRQALDETALWLEHLLRETLERMNAGLPLEAILHEVKPPAELTERPYLQPVYDEPEFVVRNIWRLYGGWYDGTPSHLKPAPEAQLGREVASLAGGVRALVARARELAGVDDLQLASHLADWAVAAAPEDRDAHAARAEIYAARTKGERALMTRGVFGAAARESSQKSGRT